MRKLSELQAWARIKKIWTKARHRNVSGLTYCITMRNCKDFGLCWTVDRLTDMDIISREMKNRLGDKIRNEKYKRCMASMAYIWPLTLEGAASRVEFCKKMIEELKK